VITVALKDEGRGKERQDIVQGGLVKIPAAAKFLGLSVAKLYQLMESRRLPYVKIDKARRIPQQSLVEFAAQHLVAPNGHQEKN
jgi:excisionase family DNA binding protein